MYNLTYMWNVKWNKTTKLTAWENRLVVARDGVWGNTMSERSHKILYKLPVIKSVMACSAHTELIILCCTYESCWEEILKVNTRKIILTMCSDGCYLGLLLWSFSITYRYQVIVIHMKLIKCYMSILLQLKKIM